MTEAENLGALLIDQIREGMVYDDAWRGLENGFEYWIGGHRQVVTWDGPYEQNDMVGWLVTAKTDFLRETSPNESGNLSSLARLTSKLTFCGIIPAEYESDWALASSVLVHEENFSWIARPLFQGCTQQFLHCFDWHLLMPEIKSRFLSLKTDPPSESDPELVETIQSQVEQLIDNAENDEFSYCEDELQKAKEFFQNPPCLMCTGERTKLTAEFPFAKFSQLLTVNPKYRQKEGLGILVALRLPYPREIEQVVDLAFRLNEAELRSANPGYFLGSWYLDETSGNTLGYSQFIPNAYLQPNLFFNYLIGFVSRAAWVDELLNEIRWEDSFDEVVEQRKELVEKALDKLSDEAGLDLDSLEKLEAEGEVSDFYFEKTSDMLGIFGEPVELPDSFFEQLSQYPLFQYGIFNPMGPSWNLLTLSQHPRHNHLLLCNRMLNPFAQFNLALAGFDKNEEFDLPKLLESVFKQNGTEDKPLLKSAPTWVVIPSGESDSLADAAFSGLFQTLGAEPLRSGLHYLREYPGQPWERAAAEMESALKEQLDMESREKFPDFDEWWEIVTDENHLQTEVKNMIPAWNGAIDFQKRSGEELVARMFPNLMEMGGLFKAIGQSGMGDQIITRFIQRAE